MTNFGANLIPPISTDTLISIQPCKLLRKGAYDFVDWASKEWYQDARCYPLASQDHVRWKEEIIRRSQRKESEATLQNCEMQWLTKQIWVRRLEKTRKRVVKSYIEASKRCSQGRSWSYAEWVSLLYWMSQKRSLS